MYPNDYCNQCNPSPQPVVTSPPTCTGNPCAEVMNTQCINYDGLKIECLGVTTEAIENGVNMNEILTVIGNIFCNTCNTPALVVTATCNSITITVADPQTSIDLYEFQYSLDGNTWTTITSEYGEYSVTVEDLDELIKYYYRVRKVCLVEGGALLPDGLYSEWETYEITTIECED